jgi:hypothetical protein
MRRCEISRRVSGLPCVSSVKQGQSLSSESRGGRAAAGGCVNVKAVIQQASQSVLTAAAPGIRPPSPCAAGNRVVVCEGLEWPQVTSASIPTASELHEVPGL